MIVVWSLLAGWAVGLVVLGLRRRPPATYAPPLSPIDVGGYERRLTHKIVEGEGAVDAKPVIPAPSTLRPFDWADDDGPDAA